MLKGIPDIISPELLKILHEMGHGDELVIGDGNFPAASNAKRLVRCDGHTVPPLLDAILQLFPLDTAVESPVILMAPMPGDTVDPNVKKTYAEIVAKSGDFKSAKSTGLRLRGARQAYAIVAKAKPPLRQ